MAFGSSSDVRLVPHRLPLLCGGLPLDTGVHYPCALRCRRPAEAGHLTPRGRRKTHQRQWPVSESAGSGAELLRLTCFLFGSRCRLATPLFRGSSLFFPQSDVVALAHFRSFLFYVLVGGGGCPGPCRLAYASQPPVSDSSPPNTIQSLTHACHRLCGLRSVESPRPLFGLVRCCAQTHAVCFRM